jgi:hypothetical protein
LSLFLADLRPIDIEIQEIRVLADACSECREGLHGEVKMFGGDGSEEEDGLLIEGCKFLSDMLQEFVAPFVIAFREMAECAVIVGIGKVRAAFHGHFE